LLDELSRAGKDAFHHIFHKSQLKGTCTTREADDIANLAFIGGKTNRVISDKSPADYFPALIDKAGESAFMAQCIPLDPTLLKPDRYKDFLAERRRLISARLNEFLLSN